MLRIIFIIGDKKNKKKGFTVVELIVAMSVFVVLITIAVGAFIQVVRSQRMLNHLMMINDNAGFVLEQMAREIRAGYDFCSNIQSKFNKTPQPCEISSTSTLTFTNYKGQSVTYATSSDDGILKNNNTRLTSNTVKIKKLNFSISQNNDYCYPWRVTIFMEVASISDKIRQTVPLQTTISSRVLPGEVPGASQDVINQCAF